MKSISLILILFFFEGIAQDGVGIGITAPEESAILHANAPDNNKGMLIPRLTTTQRDNIIKPAHGLIIFNESTQAFNYCHVAGVDTSWVQLIPTPSTFDLDMGNNTITNLADGTNEKDAVNKGQLDAVEAKHDAFETTVNNYALLENRSWITRNLNVNDVQQVSFGGVTRRNVQSVNGTLKYADMGSLCWLVELSFEAQALSSNNIDELFVDFSSLDTNLKTAIGIRASRIPVVIRRITGTGLAHEVTKIAQWYPDEEDFEIETFPSVGSTYDNEAGVSGSTSILNEGDTFRVHMAFFVSK